MSHGLSLGSPCPLVLKIGDLMSQFRSRWRGVALCLVTAMALLAALVGPASATQSLDVANRTSLTLDGDAHWWQQGAQDHYKMVSYNGYQYTVYWDAADGSGNVYLKITRRRLSDDNLQTITFNNASGKLADPQDPHDTTVLGMSPIDGRLHVQWADHSGPIHYAISSSGCLTQATFSSCTFTWQHQTSNTGQEADVTYPMYVNNKAGDLYCGFRSGNGNASTWVWHGYNNNGTWSDLGNVLDGTTGSGSYDVDGAAGLNLGWNPATTRGAYVDAVAFDSNDRLHLMWTWRENVTNAAVDPFFEQHDVYYAYSDDYGLTWKDNGGTTVGTHNSDPIVVGDTSTLAVSLGLGWYRPNDARMVIDRDNQPHVILPTSDTNTLDRPVARLRSTHVWRTTDGVWHQQFVEPTGDAQQSVSIGDLTFDRANNAYYIYPRNRIGWYPWNDDAHHPTYNVDFPADHFTIDGTNGYLVMSPTTALSQIDTTDYVNVPIGTGSSDNRDVVIRVKNTTDATDGYVYFYTDAHPVWVAGMWRSMTVPNDGLFHTITVPMQGATNWSGTLRQLEMLPSSSATAGSGTWTVDYIRVENDATTIAKSWDFTTGIQLYAAEADGTTNWASWDIYDIAPGASLSWYDAISFDIDQARYNTDKKIDFPVLEQGAPGTESMKSYEYSIIGDGVAKTWGFGADAIGWNAPKDVSGFGWTSDSGRGTISGTITNNDSELQSANNLHTPIGTGSTLSIRMKNSTATGQTLSVCWAVDGQQTYSSPSRCVQNISVTADGAYHIYNISTSAWGSWAGHELTRLRIDPSDGSTITSGTFNIDYVRILD